jgi:ABC-2 type transport system permease protein
VSSPSEGRPGGVIHDIGYRPYAGPRLGEAAVAWSLFVTGLRNCYGLGRSGRSKVLPMILLGLMLLPAVILVGVEVQLGLDQQLMPYSGYPLTTSVLISVFVAAQAPTLISRDLRFGTITLYLARPLRRSTYVLVRLASLTVATFLLIWLPMLLLYVGGLLGDMPVWRETRSFLVASLGAVLLAAALGVLAALISAVTTRRGLAVAAIIVVLLVSYTVVTTVQGIAVESGNDTIAQVVGVLAPYSLVNGLQVWYLGAPDGSPASPTSGVVGLVFLLATVMAIILPTAALLLRYRRAAIA